MKILVIVLFIIAILLAAALSWGTIAGLVWLVCLIGGWPFDVIVATEIWLLLCVVWAIIQNFKEER